MHAEATLYLSLILTLPSVLTPFSTFPKVPSPCNQRPPSAFPTHPLTVFPSHPLSSFPLIPSPSSPLILSPPVCGMSVLSPSQVAESCQGFPVWQADSPVFGGSPISIAEAEEAFDTAALLLNQSAATNSTDTYSDTVTIAAQGLSSPTHPPSGPQNAPPPTGTVTASLHLQMRKERSQPPGRRRGAGAGLRRQRASGPLF